MTWRFSGTRHWVVEHRGEVLTEAEQRPSTVGLWAAVRGSAEDGYHNGYHFVRTVDVGRNYPAPLSVGLARLGGQPPRTGRAPEMVRSVGVGSAP